MWKSKRCTSADFEGADVRPPLPTDITYAPVRGENNRLSGERLMEKVSFDFNHIADLPVFYHAFAR